MKKILTVIGTRPEAIKLHPVLIELNKHSSFKSEVCITRQHTTLLDPILTDLRIKAEYQLETYSNPNTLHQSAANILSKLDNVFFQSKPDLVLVQGDTTTAFSAALAAYYSRIPVAHVEAGLRTGDIYSPWPEEGHRCLINKLTNYFFAPTVQAKNTLIAEGVAYEKIWLVGNTSIDAIRLLRKNNKAQNSNFKTILVTVHRRENHGDPLKEICNALKKIAQEFDNVSIKFILHPNIAVRKPVIEMLSGIQTIDLIEPLNHKLFIELLDKSSFIITDSGGIQEEAPFMGKPILIVRDTTERPEGVKAGTARLIGTSSANIIAHCKELLEKPEALVAMSKIHFPYGDGFAAKRIVKILDSKLNGEISLKESINFHTNSESRE